MRLKRRKIKGIEAYPPNFCRTLDFIPILSLQRALEPDLQMGYLEAIVSIKPKEVMPIHREIKTNLGGTIKQDDVNRRMTKIEYGKPSLSGLTNLSQKEIFDDIITNVPIREEVPEVVLRKRICREDVPKAVEELKPLEGSDEIFHLQIARANHVHKIRKMFGLWQIQNPYQIIKNDIVDREIVPYYDPIFRRFRSVLKTEWLVTNRTGWRNLIPVMLPLHRSLCQSRWWQDIGLPHPLTGRVDHTIIKAQIYRLFRRKELVAV